MEVGVRMGRMRYKAELGLGERIVSQMDKAAVRLLGTRDIILAEAQQERHIVLDS